MKLAVCLIPLLLAGCYTVDQVAFETHINERIKPGMLVDSAVSALRSEGFNCDLQFGALATGCIRRRQPFSSSSCVERVYLTRNVFSDAREVRSVEVDKIDCTGT